MFSAHLSSPACSSPSAPRGTNTVARTLLACLETTNQNPPRDRTWVTPWTRGRASAHRSLPINLLLCVLGLDSSRFLLALGAVGSLLSEISDSGYFISVFCSAGPPVSLRTNASEQKAPPPRSGLSKGMAALVRINGTGFTNQLRECRRCKQLSCKEDPWSQS